MTKEDLSAYIRSLKDTMGSDAVDDALLAVLAAGLGASATNPANIFDLAAKIAADEAPVPVFRGEEFEQLFEDLVQTIVEKKKELQPPRR